MYHFETIWREAAMRPNWGASANGLSDVRSIVAGFLRARRALHRRRRDRR